MQKLIGGFFGLAKEESTQQSLYEAWHLTNKTFLAFHNARSALYHLLAKLNLSRIWLPSYCCDSLIDACTKQDTYFYPIDKSLDPDLDYLSQRLQAGDAVIVIDYFGRNPSDKFLSWVKKNPQYYWIEDCAQAIAPYELWGDYLIYSPRKICGVADGGILVSNNSQKAFLNIELNEPSNKEFMQAAILRFEDKAQTNNDSWFPIYQRKEAQEKVSLDMMSKESLELLQAIDFEKIKHRRLANYQILQTYLSDISFLGEVNDFIPFGFITASKQCAMLQQALIAKNIFAARYWYPLPKQSNFDDNADDLANRLLMLPCDQRYGENEMHYIIDQIRGSE